MSRKSILSLSFCLFLVVAAGVNSFGQLEPNEICADFTMLNRKVPSPLKVLGFRPGEWHVSHDKLVQYFRALSAGSARVKTRTIGSTHEGRPLLNVFISDPANIANLEEIRLQRKEAIANLDYETLQTLPLVIYQGYSIHGDEASGANASLLYAWLLAARQDAELEEMLKRVIIIIDPCLNPDGLDRFASWVNSHRSFYPQEDGLSREHQQAWPGARTNHYWFDLNRDWLLAVHPESEWRLRAFHDWEPNVLTDHHEMGRGGSFFFQPGVPQRTNPKTPIRNQELTTELGAFHAAALDAKGRKYYTKESFDDYYYGKGSTYPDINGSVGILFEQSSVRGHLREREGEDLSFSEAIQNQLLVSFSTLEGSAANKNQLQEYQVDFFTESKELIKKDKHGAMVFYHPFEKERLIELKALFRLHDIRVYRNAEEIKIGSHVFPKYQAFILPFNQKQYRLAKAMVEEHKSFNDSIFYDVSTWPIQHAYGLEYACIPKRKFKESMMFVPKLDVGDYAPINIVKSATAVAYAIDWRNSKSFGILAGLMKKGVKCAYLNEEGKYKSEEGEINLSAGSIIVSFQSQDLEREEIEIWLNALCQGTEVKLHPIVQGLAIGGPDLGSPGILDHEIKKIGILVGRGVRSYRAGELWHLLDKKYGMSPVLIDWQDLRGGDMNRFDVLIMPDGDYSNLISNNEAQLKNWLREGRTLIACGNAQKNLINAGLLEAKVIKMPSPDSALLVHQDYESSNNLFGSRNIGGAVFKTKLDPSHPLNFGYSESELAVFKQGDLAVKAASKPGRVGAEYIEKPLVCGYAPSDKVARLAGAHCVIASPFGSGNIIGITESPSFRGYWKSTERWLINAIYFGEHLKLRN